MNVQKRVLTAAVAATLGISALPSQAMVPGVAGEALLLPMAVNDPRFGFTGQGNMNTYAVLRLPAVLGSDFVMNNFTTPNLRRGVSGSKTLTPASWTVYWTWFDPNTVSVVSGSCEGSPNDVIVWTTDEDLLYTQDEIDGASGGAPLTFCGDSNLPSIGYVVFETFAGADGLEADFAMEANAWIVDNSIADHGLLGFNPFTHTMSVPVFPMADGEDPNGANADTSPRLGLNEVVVDVSSDGGTRGDGQPRSPVVVSPMGSGVRMNNGEPGSKQQIDINGSVQAPLYGQGYSMHVLWFDRNNSDRDTTQALLYDEHEQRRDWRPPIERELNVLVYNMSYLDIDDNLDWGIFDLESGFGDLALTNLVDAVLFDPDYTSMSLPRPNAWNLSTWGYNTYLLEEEGDELGGPDGTPGVNAAAVFFEAQEINIDPIRGLGIPSNGFLWDAWTQSLMTLNGFR